MMINIVKKTTLFFLAFLLLFITSCAKKSDSDDLIVTSSGDSTEFAENENNTDESDEDGLKDKEISEDNDNTTIESEYPNIEDIENNITEQQSPTDNKESITDDTTENIKRLPTKYVEDHSVIPGLTHGYRPFYNWDIMTKSHDSETVEYNGKTYMRSMITPQFPAGTVYQSVDLGAVTATKEAVTITCASDEGYVYWTKSGVVCTLSENMENDPYVDMLAVRTVSDSGKEKTELYYIPKTRPQAESVYEIFKGNNRYYGSSCLSSDGLKSITVSEYTNSKNIDRDKDVITRKTVTNESAKKIYNMIKNGRIQTNASIADDPTIIELDFQFSDLSGERFSYFPDKSLIGYNNTYYEVPTDLKTEVNLILNNAQINN